LQAKTKPTLPLSCASALIEPARAVKPLQVSPGLGLRRIFAVVAAKISTTRHQMYEFNG